MDNNDALEVVKGQIMIYLFTGTPGSGKSLHMSEIIYYSLRLKKPIIANFEINTDAVKHPGCFGYCPNEKLTPQLLTEFSVKYFNGRRPKEGEIKVFIDECQILFNARICLSIIWSNCATR